jgi:hypothetical protein
VIGQSVFCVWSCVYVKSDCFRLIGILEIRHGTQPTYVEVPMKYLSVVIYRV